MNITAAKKRFKLYIAAFIVIGYIGMIALRNTALSNHWLFQIIDTFLVQNTFFIFLVPVLLIILFLMETKMEQGSTKPTIESEEEQYGKH